MKILKKYILIIWLFLFSITENINAQSRIFFRDTTFEYSGLKVKFENAYGRNGYVKIKVIFNNSTDRYVIINSEEIVMNTIKGVEFPAAYYKPIIVPPKDLIKVVLMFKDLNELRKSPLSICCKKIGFTDSLLTSYNPIDLRADLGAHMEYKSLAVEIIEVKPRREDYAVKMDLNYTGHNFLGIAHYKALFSNQKGSFNNTRKSRINYDNRSTSQKMLLIFPCSNGENVKMPGTIILSDVFKEYSIKTINGFTAKLTLISKEESRNKKEEVIEEIE